MKLLKELNIKSLNENRTVNINQQKSNFATYR